MYHLINRVYLDVDELKINKSNFYIASAEMAKVYGDGSAMGPSLLGMYLDEEQFIQQDFFDILNKHKDDSEKIVIYVSRETYLILVAIWVRSIFTNITDESCKALVYFEYLALTFNGLKAPLRSSVVSGAIAMAVRYQSTDAFRLFVTENLNRVSMEYKMLLYLKGRPVQTLAEDIRMFATRASRHFVVDTQRNLQSMFFNQAVQQRYDYDAKSYIGQLNVLPMIGKFKILTDTALVNRLRNLSAQDIADMVEDIGVYLDGMSEIEDTQRKAEKSKLELISNVSPLNDTEVVDRFIQVLQTSNEHTDYLDWDDGDMLNIPLIQYIISLTNDELEGF